MYKLREFVKWGPDINIISCSRNALFLMKKAEINSSNNWRKNIEAYHRYKKYVNNTEWEQDFFRMRKSEVEVKKTKFKDVDKPQKPKMLFDHKDLYRAIAVNNSPVYEKISGGSLKSLNEGLFYDLPIIDQIYLVLEDAYAIALEKKIVPEWPGNLNELKLRNSKAQNCFMYGYQRLCTKTPYEWYRDYAIENYQEIMHHYSYDYVNRFRTSYEKGKIKCLTKKS